MQKSRQLKTAVSVYQSIYFALSASQYSIASGWRRRIEAGHAVLMSPVSAALTAFAFVGAGTMQNTFLAETSVGTVSVSA